MFLTSHGQRVVSHLARVILDVPSGRLPDIEQVDLIAQVDRLLQRVPFGVRWSYRIFLWLFEYAAMFYRLGGVRPFTEMNREDQRAYIRAWQLTPWSPRRFLRRCLESIIQMVYYSQPSVAQACGWTRDYQPAMKAAELPLREASAGKAYTQSGVYCAPPTDCLEHFHASADVIVIGSGAGGGVIADELARAGREVLVIEEGDAHNAAEFRGDVMQVMEKCYRDVGMTMTFGWPAILVPYGCAVGGTTVINSGTMIQTPDSVLEHWEHDYRMEGWGRGALDTGYAQARERLGVVPVPDVIQGPHAQIFARGSEKLGHQVRALPRNAAQCSGSGICCYGCPTNAKQSMALTYLPSACRHGARIFANARVQELVHSNGVVTAVQGLWGKGAQRRPFTITAKTVVLCAGTLQTPLLLNRSGIRDSYSHVGRHLTLHPTVKVVAEMPEPVGAWRGVPQGMYCDALEEQGMKLESIFLPPAHTAVTLMESGQAHRKVMERYTNLAAFGALISDTGEGRVISFRGQAAALYNIPANDLPKYYRALEFLAEAFLAAGAERVHLPFHGAPSVTPAEGVARLQQATFRRKDLDVQAFHPLGTCRMAGDPEHGALDPTGKMHHMRNLYVADGSIFPTSLGVNPQLTIMAAAHKIAQNIA